MKRLLITLAVACLMASSVKSEEARLLRFPDIHRNHVIQLVVDANDFLYPAKDHRFF